MVQKKKSRNRRLLFTTDFTDLLRFYILLICEICGAEKKIQEIGGFYIISVKLSLFLSVLCVEKKTTFDIYIFHIDSKH